MITKAAQIIEAEIKAIVDGEPKAWPQISALMHAVYETRYWESVADSFSHWLVQFSEQTGLSKASVWRYFSVGKKYKSIKRSAELHGQKYPDLEDLQNHVSAENLELLEKISRVVEQDEIYPMMHEIVAGTMRRKEMRDRWNAFKPALEGQTARGNIDTPKVNKKNRDQVLAVEKGRIVEALRKTGPSWLGLTDPEYFRLCTDTIAEPRIKVGDFSSPYGRPEYHAPSMVILVKETNSTPMVSHGLEICLDLKDESIQMLSGMSRFCDLSWLVIPVGIGNINPDAIPDNFGVLGYSASSGFKVITQAPIDMSPPDADRILKGILAKLK